MKKILLLLSCLILLTADALADSDNYLCSKYRKLKVSNVDKVLAVGINRIYTGSVETYVLGYGTPIKASISGIKLGMEHISKRRTLVCDNQRVGQIRIYNLSGLGIDVGEFVIESGDKKVSTYIEID
ncbi:MAG: hypothetical protein ACI4UM_02650 [Succinivibrio sp.]